MATADRAGFSKRGLRATAVTDVLPPVDDKNDWFIEVCPKVPSAAMATSHMKFSVLGQTHTLAATGAQITVSHIDA